MAADDEQSGAPVPGQQPGLTRGHPRLRRTLIVVGSVAAVLFVLAGAGAYALYTRFQQIDVIQVPGADTETAANEPMSILLLGSDSRSGRNAKARYGLDAGRDGERSDTTILLHISADRTNALAVSIPRDLWVEQPACATDTDGYYAKFNNAFSAGGAACTRELVQQITGVHVNHVVVVDFAGFKDMVDAMGGVEVCLNNPIHDTDALLDLPAGTTVITGERALAFVRARKSVGDGSDIGRIKRQQAFLSAAIRKVTSPSFLLNPAQVYGLLDTATSSLTVSQGLDGVMKMKDLADSVRNISPSDITFVTLPFTYREDGANVELDADQAEPIFAAIREDTPWPPPVTVGPDGKKLTVAPADITVDVVNASGGVVSSQRVTRQLAAAGFEVGTVTTATAAATTEVRSGDAEAARTVAYATNSLAVTATGGSVTVVVGGDWSGVSTDIVVTKHKPSDEPGSGSITKADQVICAN